MRAVTISNVFEGMQVTPAAHFNWMLLSGTKRKLQAKAGERGVVVLFDPEQSKTWVKVEWDNGLMDNYPMSDLEIYETEFEKQVRLANE